MVTAKERRKFMLNKKKGNYDAFGGLLIMMVIAVGMYIIGGVIVERKLDKKENEYVTQKVEKIEGMRECNAEEILNSWKELEGEIYVDDLGVMNKFIQVLYGGREIENVTIDMIEAEEISTIYKCSYSSGGDSKEFNIVIK